MTKAIMLTNRSIQGQKTKETLPYALESHNYEKRNSKLYNVIAFQQHKI